MIHSGNSLTAPWKGVSSCWPLQSPFLSLLGAGAAHGMLSTFLRLLGTGRRKEPLQPLQLWLPGWHTSTLEVLPRQRSHRQSPPPGTCSPFWSLVVNRGQGLLKVKQWEHPRVLAQMFLAGMHRPAGGSSQNRGLWDKGDHYKPAYGKGKQGRVPVDLSSPLFPPERRQ